MRKKYLYERNYVKWKKIYVKKWWKKIDRVKYNKMLENEKKSFQLIFNFRTIITNLRLQKIVY